METRAHYVAVGAFVLILLFAAAGAVIWLAELQFNTQYNYYDIYFREVSGLSPGAQVQYNGVPVGRVASVRISRTNVGVVRVFVEINHHVIIKSDAVAGLQTSLLSGVSFIQITGGTQAAPVLVAKEGHTYPVINAKASSLERLYSRAPQLLGQLIDVTDKLNKILDQRNRDALAASLANVKTLTGGLVARTNELGTTISTANSTIAELDSFVHSVNDSYTRRDGLKDQLSMALGDVDRLARGLIDTNRQVQATVRGVRPGIQNFTDRTLPQVGDLVGDARQLVSGLSRLASEIERDPTRFLFGDRRAGYSPR